MVDLSLLYTCLFQPAFLKNFPEQYVHNMHGDSHALKREVGIKASEIFVGGSLGQGTIVYEHYDIDLVLYSTSKTTHYSNVVS